MPLSFFIPTRSQNPMKCLEDLEDGEKRKKHTHANKQTNTSKGMDLKDTLSMVVFAKGNEWGNQRKWGFVQMYHSFNLRRNISC